MFINQRAASIACAALFFCCGEDESAPRPTPALCSAYGEACANPCDQRGTKQVLRIDGDGSTRGLQLALEVAMAWSDERPAAQDLLQLRDAVGAELTQVFGQCEVPIHWARARASFVPSAALGVTAISSGSRAGFAPDDVDSRAFHYQLNEALPVEVLEWLQRSRAELAPNVITINLFDDVYVFKDDTRKRIGGYAFIPNTYHRKGDFPARNAVLISGAYPRCGALPRAPAPRVVAHEIGHMLLNESEHHEEVSNLMSRLSGPRLTAEQCGIIRANVSGLYGPMPLRDPGPPTNELKPVGER